MVQQAGEYIVGGHLLQGVEAHPGVVNVDGFADGAHVAGRFVYRPGGPGHDPEPALFAVQVQLAVVGDDRLDRPCIQSGSIRARTFSS